MNMPEIMDWQGGSHAGITRAVDYLRSGRLVALPTESTYVVVGSALAPEAMAAFDRAMAPAASLMLLLGQAPEVFDWLPNVRGAGLRLVKRFWPGPLILSSGAGVRQGLLGRLPHPVQRRLSASPLTKGWARDSSLPPLAKGGPGGGLPDQNVSVRLPAHQASIQVAQRLGSPLVAWSTGFVTPEPLIEAVGARIALIVNDGATALGKPDTFVQTHGRHWQIVGAAAITAAEIDATAPCRIIFVCTGNTCRSPLAEALCKKLLADKLHCPPDELMNHGFLVQSAGLAATMGCAAAPEAVAVAREWGADLTGHQSQPLSAEMVLAADRVYTMTASHLRVLDGLQSGAPRLLSPAGDDVADPIGASAEVYEACARQMYSYLEVLVPEWLEC